MSGDCHVCKLDKTAKDDAIVYRDDTWMAASPIDVPGWFMLFTHQHNDGLWTLTEQEAVEFGRLSHALSAVLEQVCDAERVYLMYQGENTLHFHALLVARGADVPVEWRGPAPITKANEMVAPEESRRLAAEVKAALAARLG